MKTIVIFVTGKPVSRLACELRIPRDKADLRKQQKEKVMNKMLVVVFDDEKKAYEGVKALKELHNEASLTLYATAVIDRDKNGKVTVKEAADQGATGTAVGLLTGSLLGLLGGPVGFAVGASTGALGGMAYDLVQLGVGSDFLDEVSQTLTPGKVAVVAEVDEEWVSPLDTRMEKLGGIVDRRARFDVIDAQVDREIAATTAEFAELQAEHRKAVGEAKAKLKAKVDTVHDRLAARRNLLQQKMEDIKHEGEAKVKSMESQVAKTTAETRARLEKRIEEIRVDYNRRTDKLRKAWELIKEAAA
jgi:uncharacterized membrane protein